MAGERALALTVLGVAVPEAGPLFLATLALHIAAGLVATVAGTVATLAPKRRGRHARAGTVFAAAVAVVVVTAGVMAAIRWHQNSHLVLIAALAGAFALVGWRARRRRWRRWPLWHGAAMGGAFIALMTGFYVDNGPQLPVWRQLPPRAFWFLPAAVGIPLTWWALIRNRALRGPPGRRPPQRRLISGRPAPPPADARSSARRRVRSAPDRRRRDH